MVAARRPASLVVLADVAVRPRTRGECARGPRPWISCRYHLADVVTDAQGCGTRVLDLSLPRDARPADEAAWIEDVAEEVASMQESCALDLAEHDGMTLEQCGQVMRVTRERIRQVEKKARERMGSRRRRAALRELW